MSADRWGRCECGHYRYDHDMNPAEGESVRCWVCDCTDFAENPAENPNETSDDGR